MHLAKKMIEDRSRDYMNARRVAKVSLTPAFVFYLILAAYVLFEIISSPLEVHPRTLIH